DWLHERARSDTRDRESQPSRSAARRRAPAGAGDVAALPAVHGGRPRADGALYAVGPMRTKVLVSVVTATLVILFARTIAYASQPGSEARLFQQQAGGPAFPTLVLVTLAIGAASAVVV